MEAQAPHSTGGHERSDVRIKPLVVFTVVLAVVVGLSSWMLAALHQRWESQAAAQDLPLHSLAPARELPPSPRLQRSPGAELEEQRLKEDAWLSSYGWVDRGQGIVRIPIERAIELTLQQGLPAREKR